MWGEPCVLYHSLSISAPVLGSTGLLVFQVGVSCCHLLRSPWPLGTATLELGGIVGGQWAVTLASAIRRPWGGWETSVCSQDNPDEVNTHRAWTLHTHTRTHARTRTHLDQTADFINTRVLFQLSHVTLKAFLITLQADVASHAPRPLGNLFDNKLSSSGQTQKDEDLCGPSLPPHSNTLLNRLSLSMLGRQSAPGRPLPQSPLIPPTQTHTHTNSSMREGQMQQQELESDSRKDIPQNPASLTAQGCWLGCQVAQGVTI